MPKVAKEKVKLEPKGKTIAELAKELKAAKATKKKHEDAAEAQGGLIHAITVRCLPKLMEDMEGDGINVVGVGYVELGDETYPSIKKDDEDAWFAWLRKNGLGDIIKETIHPKTLQAMVSEQLVAGKKFPDYVNVAIIPTAKLKAEKKKGK